MSHFLITIEVNHLHIKEKVVTKSTLVTMHYLLVASLKGNAYFSKAAAFSHRFA